MPQAKGRTRRPLVQSTLGFFEVPKSANVLAVPPQTSTSRPTRDFSHKRKGTTTTATNTTKSNDKKKRSKTSAARDASSANDVKEESSASSSQIPSVETSSAPQQQQGNGVAIQKENDPPPPESATTNDIVPFTKGPPRNIALRLHQQNLKGTASRISMLPSTTTTSTWSNASWLKLQCPRQARPLTGACIMEWDPMGVLLAVMTSQDSILRIYDWDTVSSANAKGRNHRARRKTNPQANYTGGSFRIDVTLCTNVRLCGNQIRKLAWNPFNPDQIVILDSNNLLYMIDLANEAASQQRARGNVAGVGVAIPIKVELPFRRHLTANIVFLAADTMIVTAGDQIACISLRNSTTRRTGVPVVLPSVKWSFTWKENTVSSLVRLGAEFVVLGSSRGNLSVINWKQTQIATFATVSRPVVLESWFSANGIRHPGAMHMGVHHLTVEHHRDDMQQPVFGDTRISWVTSCGWAMSAVIDVRTGKAVEKSKVLHSAAPIRCMNHRDEAVNLGKKGGWSLPAQEIQSCGTTGFLCWECVPDVVQVLPDHNKFVLNDRPRHMTVSRQPSLHVMNRWTGQMHELILSRGQSRVSVIAMHVSEEWVLVATENDGVRFYNSRRKM